MQPYFTSDLVRDNGVLRPLPATMMSNGYKWPEEALEVLREYAGCDLYVEWRYATNGIIHSACIWALIDGEVVHTYSCGDPSMITVVTPSNTVLRYSPPPVPDGTDGAGTWLARQLPLDCVQVWDNEYGMTETGELFRISKNLVKKPMNFAIRLDRVLDLSRSHCLSCSDLQVVVCMRYYGSYHLQVHAIMGVYDDDEQEDILVLVVLKNGQQYLQVYVCQMAPTPSLRYEVPLDYPAVELTWNYLLCENGDIWEFDNKKCQIIDHITLNNRSRKQAI